MRDKLISILGDKIQYGVGYSVREDYPFTPEGGGGGGVIGRVQYSLGDIADHLITHGVTVQEWVSVEDALPENGKYLVRCKHMGVPYMDILSFTHDYRSLDKYDWYSLEDKKDFWFDCDAGHGLYIEDGVTHWMKLPAPPKEE